LIGKGAFGLLVMTMLRDSVMQNSEKKENKEELKQLTYEHK